MIKEEYIALLAAASPVLQDSLNTAGLELHVCENQGNTKG